MSRGSSNPTNPIDPQDVRQRVPQRNPDSDPKLLPDALHVTAGLPAVQAVTPAATSAPATSARPPAEVIPATPPARQLSDRPQEELEIIAEDLGLKTRRYKTRQLLISAIHGRRQLIAGMNREAMVDVLRWANRPPPPGTSKEGLAHEIVSLRTMRFEGLTQRGLVVLSALRGLEVKGDEAIPLLVRRLKRQETLFSKINRKRRTLLGAVVSNFVGSGPAAASRPGAPADTTAEGRSLSIKHEIEEAGLFGGLAGRIKKSADGYVNQKLDEIEARIDRKLDEIDRRLAEWRDKEIANRILILKITLWASVIVGLFSLIYSYVQIHFFAR
jgi:hypothetical protein